MALNKKGRDLLYTWTIFDAIGHDGNRDLEKIPKAIKIINKSIFFTGFLTHQEYVLYQTVPIADAVLYKYSVHKEPQREININKVLEYLNNTYFTKIFFKNNMYYISEDGIYNSNFEPLLVVGYYNDGCVTHDINDSDRCSNYIEDFKPTLLVNIEIYSNSTDYLNNQILRFIIPYAVRSIQVLTLSKYDLIRLLNKVEYKFKGTKYLDDLVKTCSNTLDTSWIISQDGQEL